MTRPSAAAPTPTTRLISDVGAGASQLAVLDQALRLEHPGRERGVGAERRGAGEQQASPVNAEADEQAEQQPLR